MPVDQMYSPEAVAERARQAALRGQPTWGQPATTAAAPAPAPIGLRGQIEDMANNQYLPETQRLAQGEDAARGGATRFLQSAFNERGGGYLEDKDIASLYAGKSDEASRGRSAAYRAAGSSLGSRGITGGGYVTGLGGRIEAQHLGQLAVQKRTLKEFQMQFNAQRAGQRFAGAQAIGAAMSQGPSDAYAQGIGNVMGVKSALYGADTALAAANSSASAQKKAGKSSGAGQVLSSVISRA